MPKILIVEDDEFIQDYLKRKLEDCGFEISSATTKDQAREIFPTQPWDLIAMDACVPGDRVNTEDLVAEFSQTFTGPMVAISSSEEYNNILLQAGCNQACSKYDLIGFIKEFFA